MKLIDENLSEYYDNEMNLHKRINFETKLINQKYFKEGVKVGIKLMIEAITLMSLILWLMI